MKLTIDIGLVCNRLGYFTQKAWRGLIVTPVTGLYTYALAAPCFYLSKPFLLIGRSLMRCGQHYQPASSIGTSAVLHGLPIDIADRLDTFEMAINTLIQSNGLLEQRFKNTEDRLADQITDAQDSLNEVKKGLNLAMGRLAHVEKETNVSPRVVAMNPGKAAKPPKKRVI